MTKVYVVGMYYFFYLSGIVGIFTTYDKAIAVQESIELPEHAWTKIDEVELDVDASGERY